MKLGMEFFRSRVAQRIFLLFISSALIPIIILATIHYKIVIKEIYDQHEIQIHENSKSLGMDINKHIQFVREDMEIIASLRASKSPAILQNIPEEFNKRLKSQLRGLMVVTERGNQELLLGQPFSPPEISPMEKDRILSGEFLIKAEYHPENQSRIYMCTALDSENKRKELLWAEANPYFLWFMGADYTLPSNIDLCILDQSNNPLLSTLRTPLFFPEEVVLKMEEGFPSRFEWTHQEKDYLAGYRPIPLRNRYIADDWKVVLSLNKANIFEFTKFFSYFYPLAILASLWLVLFLSTIQIRRSLIPLEKIKEGTKRLAKREFDSRVVVTSNDEFKEVAESFNSMASQLGKQFRALVAMGEMDRAILSVLDTEKIVNTLVARIREVFPCKSMSMTVIDPSTFDTAQTYIGVDQDDKEKHVETVKITPEEIQTLRDNPETLLITKDENIPHYLAPLADRGIKSFLVLPLFLKEGLTGILALGYVKQPKFAQEDHDNARRLANQVAVAFSNARLIEELNELNWGTLTALARTIDAKSPWTAGHSERSTKVAIQIGEVMMLSQEEIDDLHRGGLLHDIGKLGIPHEILDKQGKLNREERKIMETHVQLGVRILEPISAYSKIIPVVLQHHERFNGRGYPNGLKGDSIELGARIFAVADTFEAMTSDRPYRDAFERNVAIETITKSAGNDFDPQVVQAFLKVMNTEA